MKAFILIVVLLGGALLIEYGRCRVNDLPPAVYSSSLRGAPECLLHELGEPDLRFPTTAPRLYREGVGNIAVSAGSLKGLGESPLEVLFWKRNCFFGAGRQFMVVIRRDSGRIVHYDAASTGWMTPVMVLEGENDTEECVVSLR